MIAQSFEVRAIRDDAGLEDATIFVSGSVDEHLIAQAIGQQAPIDAFGVGTRLGVSADAPSLDMASKLVSYDGHPTLKPSKGKATWPGAKQVWRVAEPGALPIDTITTEDGPGPENARRLLVDVMGDGKRVGGESLAQARERLRAELDVLPNECKVLVQPDVPTARFSDTRLALRDRCIADLSRADVIPTAE